MRFTTAAALVHELMEARDEKRLFRLQKHLARQELLIVDELGFVPLSKAGAEMLFEVFSQRYERARPGHQQSAVRRMDRSTGFGAADRRAAGSLDAPRSYPGDERRQLPAEKQTEKGRNWPVAHYRIAGRFGPGFRFALTTPPYGRRRAPLQPPQTREYFPPEQR